MVEKYFSDTERGAKPRTSEEISDTLWAGIVGLIESELNKQSFAIDFPDQCSDGGAVAGTDHHRMSLLLRGEIREIEWPLQLESKPNNLVLLDVIQFCFHHIGEAGQGAYHNYYKHYHFVFDRQAGQDRFRKSINRLFARNGIVFELAASGSIVRLGSPVFQTVLDRSLFSTGDATLDSLLEEARQKFTSPDSKVRKDGLDKLWDAWERVKTLEPGRDKKDSTAKLLDKAATEHTFRQLLESEAKELTRIGNDFRIRHSETNRIEIDRSAHVDYLFYRLFSLISLLLLTR